MKKGKQPEPSSAKNPKGASGQASRAKAEDKPVKSAEVKPVAKLQETPDDHSEVPDDQPGRKSYRKREVVSNWDRYESYDPDISSDHDDQQIGATKKVSTSFNLDFNELLKDSCE